MAKIHELLAVQGNLQGQATKTLTDLKASLHSKRHLYEEVNEFFQPNEEGKPTEQIEVKSIQTTVQKEIKWISKHLTSALDVSYQVDVANTQAKADIVAEDGTIIAKDVPATFLLQLEKRVVEWQDLIDKIPTLDPAKGFKPDPAKGEGYYVARETSKNRTTKKAEVITLAPATDKHPAQAVLQNIDVPVGHIIRQEWSALITPAVKADLFDKAEVLLRAVKAARAKANNVEIDTKGLKIGQNLLDFVFKPLHETA